MFQQHIIFVPSAKTLNWNMPAAFVIFLFVSNSHGERGTFNPLTHGIGLVCPLPEFEGCKTVKRREKIVKISYSTEILLETFFNFISAHLK